MSLKDLLVRARLIESDGGEVEAESEASSSTTGAAESAVVGQAGGAQEVSSGLSGESVSGVALEALYANAGIPSAVYPAERVLKILDGLAAMDPPTKRAAIAAMDAADDTWTVDDVIGDAARKSMVLKAHVDQLARNIVEAQQQESAQKTALTSNYDELCASIDAQIAQLREAAQLAASEHAKAIAALAERTATAIATCRSEQARIQSEVDRLDGLARELGCPSA